MSALKRMTAQQLPTHYFPLVKLSGFEVQVPRLLESSAMDSGRLMPHKLRLRRVKNDQSTGTDSNSTEYELSIWASLTLSPPQCAPSLFYAKASYSPHGVPRDLPQFGIPRVIPPFLTGSAVEFTRPFSVSVRALCHRCPYWAVHCYRSITIAWRIPVPPRCFR